MTFASRHFALILAAGSSQRMGRDKASLPWLDGKSLLDWTADAFFEAGWQPVVVLGPHNQTLGERTSSNALFAVNSRPAEGKTTSVAAGLQAVPKEADSILIASIDQPRLPELYRRLREASDHFPASILSPDNGGRSGHPIVFDSTWRESLSRLNEARQGLRGLLLEHQDAIHRLPCEPDGLRWDFNTPEAYEEALVWFQAQPGMR